MDKKITDYAAKILSDHGCDTHSYYGVSLETTINDLKEAYPDGMDYPYDQVAKAILEISTPTTSQISRNGFEFDDWGSWGVGDFYDAPLSELKAAVESGKTFNTGWHGYKKELQSMCIIRSYEETLVCCNAYMDSALEDTGLIYDCLEDNEYDLLDDDKIEEIRNYLDMGDFVEEISDEQSLPVDASIEEIMKAAEDLIQSLNNRLTDSFKECISTTLIVLYGYSDETIKRIEDRIKKYCPE